ncbi:hypothetical protein CXF86_11085 [Shewanella sp. GutCb]|uniref:FRG domain-containing protein n=1 Tax=Shewanella sp. GutCb TaxID=2058315 RepID=UPI000C7A4DAF|nr:FRG domain-containing protein [Shewanella sp. GutCb]PKG74826.1 hypothetical protein CXF86_11085 [Shewanella sp. GutCb]
MKNLAEVIAHITEQLDPNKEYWFRGHSKKEYKLIPTVLRPVREGESEYYDEAKLLTEFIRCTPSSRDTHKSTLELLTYAQHYGLPTRLLDWTQNLLVAIYFCCNQHHDSDGKVFILQRETETNNRLPTILFERLAQANDHFDVLSSILDRLNDLKNSEPKVYSNSIRINGKPIEDFDITDQFARFCFISQCFKGKGLFSIDSPVPGVTNHLIEGFYEYSPPLINERLKAQKGCFTVHGGKIVKSNEVVRIKAIDHYQNEVELPPSIFDTQRLIEIVIPAGSKHTILQQLNICGVNHASLFPELEHQTKMIKQNCIN